MPVVRSLFALLALAVLSAAAPSHRYEVGQVWEYQVRPGDEGSLLKIQRVSNHESVFENGSIYHISVIGFHLSNPRVFPELPHAPVSRATLDASVTRLSDDRPEFPDVEQGISEWEQANGGVYTISVSEIITILDQQTANLE